MTFRNGSVDKVLDKTAAHFRQAGVRGASDERYKLFLAARAGVLLGV